MKNVDLLKLRVGILSDSDRAFQELAILADKPEFLTMLPPLRKDFGITKLVSLEQFHNGILDSIFRNKQQEKINLLKYKKIKNVQTLLKSPEIKDTDIFEKLEYGARYLVETTLLSFALNRPRSFQLTVAEAMFCGEVSGAGCETTTPEVIDSGSVMSFFDIPRISISISPMTTYNDLEKAFREANELMKTDKRLSYYAPRVDTVNNIRRYREWYWERLKGKKYSQIADEWFNRHEKDTNVDEIAVLKGVKRYKELLKI